MAQTFSKVVFAIFRAGALVCVVLLLSGLGLAQKMVTARTTIPFSFGAEGHEFQAGDYVFDNEVPSSATIHREGTNSAVGVSIHPLCGGRDEKYFLVELWGVQARYVVTAEFEHRGEVNEQQGRVPLTIVEAHDQ